MTEVRFQDLKLLLVANKLFVLGCTLTGSFILLWTKTVLFGDIVWHISQFGIHINRIKFRRRKWVSGGFSQMMGNLYFECNSLVCASENIKSWHFHFWIFLQAKQLCLVTQSQSKTPITRSSNVLLLLQIGHNKSSNLYPTYLKGY